MIQRFIELGEGYGDFYELLELAKSNQSRLSQMLLLETNKQGQRCASVAVILHPAAKGGFMPIYYCREGITMPTEKLSKRIQLFEQLAYELNVHIKTLEVRPSIDFPDLDLYTQYLTGILRVNHCLPPLTW
ncbi:DUF7147 family protein [Alkalicoccobacillus porphyridii]|uniref:Methylthioribose kinase n=1 Tax=Alkalicoccobacillus porphyridii TaxID=2597270 RepID=A0A553ZXX9_9BACI|nr:methylthioribose kinase [Alkalicoccobacillus porphyridii]TSB46307.1 methylthioribose kinase [Alkalicoccobacillus porphyridii]